jgi:5-formyltetrahydrofolate cyclo-ligase
MLGRLRAVDAGERLRAGRDASLHLVTLLESLLPAGTPVALYSASATELPCDEAARLLATRYPVLYPRVADGALAFHAAEPSDLVPGAQGMLEPTADSPRVGPAAVVVPGRAFDRTGHRLGRGAGHYDRALAAFPPDVLRVGYAFSLQCVEAFPVEPHDQPVHVLVTEDGPPRHCRPQAVLPLPATAHALGAAHE